jgi:hypothetical protein
MDVSQPKRRLGFAGALLALQLLLSGFFFVYMLLGLMSIASCTDTSCDYALLDTIMKTFQISLALTLVLSTIGIYLLRARGWLAVAVPAVGIVVATTLVLIAYPLTRAAMELPLFGPRA